MLPLFSTTRRLALILLAFFVLILIALVIFIPVLRARHINWNRGSGIPRGNPQPESFTFIRFADPIASRRLSGRISIDPSAAPIFNRRAHAASSHGSPWDFLESPLVNSSELVEELANLTQRLDLLNIFQIAVHELLSHFLNFILLLRRVGVVVNPASVGQGVVHGQLLL